MRVTPLFTASALTVATALASPATARDTKLRPNAGDTCIAKTVNNTANAVLLDFAQTGQTVSLSRTSENMVGTVDACAGYDEPSAWSETLLGGYTATIKPLGTPAAPDKNALATPPDVCLYNEFKKIVSATNAKLSDGAPQTVTLDANAVQAIATTCEKRTQITGISDPYMGGFEYTIAPYDAPNTPSQ